RDPVRLVTVFRHCFAGLIRAKRSATLKNKSDLLVVFGIRHAGRGFPVHESCPGSVARRPSPSRRVAGSPLASLQLFCNALTSWATVSLQRSREPRKTAHDTVAKNCEPA